MTDVGQEVQEGEDGTGLGGNEVVGIGGAFSAEWWKQDTEQRQLY